MAADLFLRVDARSLEDLINGLTEISAAQRKHVFPAVLNEIGDKAFTIAKRQLAQETGAAPSRVGHFLGKRKAHPGRLAFAITAKGEFLSLKDFKPQPSKMGKGTIYGGVKTQAWGRVKIYHGSFIGPGEHVYKRLRKKTIPQRGRFKGRTIKSGPRQGQPIKREMIAKLWGPAVPREMVRGQTKPAVDQIIRDQGPKIIEGQVNRVLKRVKAKHKL